jgi:hypothetical protein
VGVINQRGEETKEKNLRGSTQSMKVGKNKKGPSEPIALTHANRQKEDK